MKTVKDKQSAKITCKNTETYAHYKQFLYV